MNVRVEGEQLTAYALGEAHAEEMWEVDAELERDPRVQAELEAICSTAALLADELTRPTGLALSAGQRAAIVWGGRKLEAEAGNATGTDESSTRADRVRRRRVIGGAMAAAAMMAAACWLMVGVRTRHVVEEELMQVEFAAGPVDGLTEGRGPGEGNGPLRARAKRRALDMRAPEKSADRRPTRADAFAAQRGKSRSQVYREALSEYLARRDPDVVTRTIDSIVEELGGGGDDWTAAAGRRALERVEW